MVFGIIFLFICISFNSSVAVANLKESTIPTSDKSIIIVDDEGDGDYTSIKEAVLNANSGDKIEVYSGKYHEGDISINKEEIVLKGIPYEFGSGNDTGKPFLFNYSKFIIESIANNVVLSGFKIENFKNKTWCSVVSCQSDGCSITDNEITDGDNGIYVYGKRNVISNNTINCHSGIHIKGKNCIISNNKLDTTGKGILLYSWSKNVTISNNEINSGQHAILLELSENCVITGNRITSRGEREFGIKFEYSNFNTVFLNEFINSHIGIFLEYSTLNLIKQNNFINNSNHSFFDGGILFNRNRWRNNYWDDWNGFGPYRIKGFLILFWILLIVYPFPIFIPWSVFDWNPASKPHIIPTGCDK